MGNNLKPNPSKNERKSLQKKQMLNKRDDILVKGEYYSKEFILARKRLMEQDDKGNHVNEYKNLKITCLGFFTSDQYLNSIEANIIEANKRLMTKEGDKSRIQGELKKIKAPSKRDCLCFIAGGEFNKDLIFRYKVELYGMEWE